MRLWRGYVPYYRMCHSILSHRSIILIRFLHYATTIFVPHLKHPTIYENSAVGKIIDADDAILIFARLVELLALVIQEFHI